MTARRGPAPLVQVSFRMSSELVAQIDSIATAQRWTRTQVIELVLELGLEARRGERAGASLELRELRTEGARVADSLEELARALRSRSTHEGGPFHAKRS